MLLKDLPTVAGAIFKEKIKIDGKSLKACESGHRHSILVREIDNFDEWFEPTDSINWNLVNGMIDIGTSTIGARLAVAITRTLSLTD